MPLPKFVMNKKAIINVRNDDNQCLKWALTRALNLVEKNPGRIAKKLKQESEQLNWTGVSFPTPIDPRDISTFEENNDVNIVILGFDTTFSLGEKRD